MKRPNGFKKYYYRGIGLIRKINFFVHENSSKFFDSFLSSIGVKNKSLSFLENGKTIRIVFVGQVPNHRVIKHMKWLSKNRNFEIILLCQSSISIKDLNENFYSKIIRFRNINHLKRIIQSSKNVNMFYAFTSKPSYARVAIEHSSVPSIFDPYDCLIVYYGTNPSLSWMKKELLDEEFCFKNANSIIARNLESQLGFKILGQKKPENIFFIDYCDNDYFVNQNFKIEKIDSEIKVVYSGGIYGRHMAKSSHGFNDFSHLINQLNNQKLHFHIYPSPYTKKETYYDYVADAKQIKYLHINPTVAQEYLSQELSQYHFGILPHFKDEDSDISEDKLKWGTSLKFFNFLEAGIPILISNEMTFMSWLVKRYDIGIVFSKNEIENLREIIISYDYSKLKKNVLKIREELSIKYNLPRLEMFIKAVSQKKKDEYK